MKKYLVKGASTLLLGGFLTSCSHDEFDISTYVADKVKAYEQVFVGEFGSIDPNQDWGFGSVTRSSGNTKGLTRAVQPWSENHTDGWESKLEFTLPDGAIDITQENFRTDGTVYYVPESFNGALDLGYKIELKEGMSLYNYGKVTAIKNVNLNGVVSFYNAGTLNFTIQSGGDHTIYNTGTLNVWQYQNIGNLYNNGTLVLERNHTADWANDGGKADIPDDMSIYSTGGVIMMPDGVGDFKAACDVHNPFYVTGDLKIQNSRTQYICWLEVTGHLEMTQGNLQASYVKANDINFDGASIWLLPQGHVVAKQISWPNSASYIYGYEGSVGLVEATDWIFRNKNNFTSAFSSNIYFKVDGSIDIEEILVRDNGQQDNVYSKYANAAEYLASQNGKELEGRINAGISVNPDCGGSGGGTPEPGEDIEIPIEDPVGGETITKKYSKTTQLIEQGRVFCEDLGQISSNDLDFNDVVFDAYIYEVKYLTETTYANGTVTTDVTSTQYDYEITLWAAGGTLALQVAEKDVKNAFGGKAVSTIINTAGAYNEAYGNQWAECKPATLKGTSYERIGIGDLPIVIQYSNHTVLKLDANLGQAPHKICVPIGTKWPKERQKIAEAYSDFNKYVTNGTEFWKGPKVDSKLYVHPDDNATTERSTEIMEEDLGTVTETESSAGGYNGTEVLSRPTK